MGATSLSKMEEEILNQLLVSEPKVIAKALNISRSTVDGHIRNVRTKYKNAKRFSNMMDSRYRSRGLSKYIWVKDIEK
jgi:FixJ family two-component response regulator